MPEPTTPGGCLPGDYTLTKIPGGFLIGRTVEQQGPGPWWKHIAIIHDRETAIAHITTMARAAGVSAWLLKDSDHELLVGREP